MNVEGNDKNIRRHHQTQINEERQCLQQHSSISFTNMLWIKEMIIKREKKNKYLRKRKEREEM